MAFVGIFVQDTESKAREFVKANKVSFPNGHDWNLVLAKPLGFRGMPSTAVISKKGEVALRFTGPVSETDLVAGIEKLLAQR